VALDWQSCDCHLVTMQDTITELRQLALTHSKDRETETAIPRVFISRCDHCESTTGPTPGFCEPMICLILQGAKCILIGDKALHYDQPSYFISTIDVPATGEVYRAGPGQPYLSISLKFDATVISDVLLSMKGNTSAASTEPGSGFGLAPVTPELLDSWLRLIRLLDSPGDIAVLGPLIEREIIYRLLGGPCGGMLRQLATGDSRLGQVRCAIGWIRDNLAEPFQVEDLAARAGMSVSAFHRHFKAVTAMSPVQYQKRLRLHVARRRLIAEAGDVARVAFSVGYESATQFGREYAREFGISPARDAARLRRLDAEGSAEMARVA
jgi:AraC-like DNA-binding protein